jgi:hypothetical protein
MAAEATPKTTAACVMARAEASSSGGSGSSDDAADADSKAPPKDAFVSSIAGRLLEAAVAPAMASSVEAPTPKDAKVAKLVQKTLAELGDVFDELMACHGKHLKEFVAQNPVNRPVKMHKAFVSCLDASWTALEGGCATSAAFLNIAGKNVFHTFPEDFAPIVMLAANLVEGGEQSRIPLDFHDIFSQKVLQQLQSLRGSYLRTVVRELCSEGGPCSSGPMARVCEALSIVTSETLVVQLDSLICEFDVALWTQFWVDFFDSIVEASVDCKTVRPAVVAKLAKAVLAKHGVDIGMSGMPADADLEDEDEEMEPPDMMMSFRNVVGHCVDTASIRQSFSASEAYDYARAFPADDDHSLNFSKFFIDFSTGKPACLCQPPMAQGSDTLHFAGPVSPLKVANTLSVRLCTVSFIPRQDDDDEHEVEEQEDGFEAETCSFGLYMSDTGVNNLSCPCPVLPWMLPVVSAEKCNMNILFDHTDIEVKPFQLLQQVVDGRVRAALPFLSPGKALTENIAEHAERVQLFRSCLPGESVGPAGLVGKKRKFSGVAKPVQLPPDIAQFVGIIPATATVAAKSGADPTAKAKGKAKAKAKAKVVEGSAAAHLLR